MNFKVCPKCGWTFPGDYKPHTCKFCSTIFDREYCRICGEWADCRHSGSGICRKCEYKQRRATGLESIREAKENYMSRATHRAYVETEESYKAWCERLSAAATHTLTEQEWLEACRYFGGCALCGAESIDARVYFIPFEDGGRYTATNIIPSCEECATACIATKNPFKRMRKDIPSMNASYKRGATYVRLEAIVEYLDEQLRRVENEE